MNTKKYNQPAFSLLETIVVLFIVTVGLLGVLTLVVNSQKTKTLNKNALVAQYLAQEGMELIRNVRDTNWLENTTSTPVAWNRYIEGSPTGSNYRVDYLTFQPTAVTDISSAKLQLATGTDLNFYLHATGSPDSIFSRLVTITAASSTAPSSTVSVLVEWLDQGQTYSYTLDSLLYDWR
ncbi:MAG TPA: type II secretion system protein [bacterium]|nr:type II secretion system protein [bacterium]HPT29798.1 type II secretion system protein [bacterium]